MNIILMNIILWVFDRLGYTITITIRKKKQLPEPCWKLYTNGNVGINNKAKCKKIQLPDKKYGTLICPSTTLHVKDIEE